VERDVVGWSVTERSSRKSVDAECESERDDDLHGDDLDGFKMHGAAE
jgi:hypothetical protein